MNKTSVVVTLVGCAFGLILGYAANKQVSGGAITGHAVTVSNSEKQSSRAPIPVSETGIPQPSKVHSEETLETLIAKGVNATYAELALWLVDASEPDIAAYWESHKNDDLYGDSNGDIRRLIFYNWTRLDPQAAIAAVAGTKRALTPWSAWGAVDPQAALAAAGPDQMKSVANGIGQMQPVWLREHFDRIPEDARQDALNGMITWKEDGDPAARLDFLAAHGMGFNSSAFKTLARKDPWVAYDWLEKNDKLDPRDKGPIDLLLETMKSGDPGDLERLAAMTPSGALQRKIEDAFFDNLLATDPAAALARAKSTEAPLVAAKRLAKIGNTLLATDPEKAFGIGANILSVCPETLSPEKRIESGRSSSSWGAEDNTTQAFMESLLIKDPVRTLEMTTAGLDTASTTFRELSGKWAERDLVAFTEWVNLQTNPTIRNAATNQVVSKLTSQGHFQEAAEWAMSGDKGNLFNLTWQWARSNRAEASAWLESAEIPESTKGNLRGIINRNP